MKKLRRVVLISVVLCAGGVISVFGQHEDKQLINKDTTRQDKTRLVQEKNIRDTARDTAVQKKKAGKNGQEMYIIPEDKKKSGTGR
jgi:uncharacterized protein HemX